MAANDTKNQYEHMTTAPVGGLILSLAVPSMVTTLITSVYNLADTFFVGQIGTSATAAVGVVFSIMMVLNALGFWVGTGGSTLVSALLGAKENRKANVIASTAFFLSLGFGVIVAIVGICGGAPLMRLLGATETIVPYALDYGYFILLAAPFSASSLALGQCLRAEGKSKESMIGQVTGGVLNMVLDPVLIYGFHMGIRGAAVATAISQVIAWGLMIRYYIQKTTQVQLSVRHISRKASEYAELFTIGFPSLCRHGSNMISNVVLNTVSGNWGDAAIAAMSICGRLMYLSNAVSIGMNQGSQPVIGYAHGMNNHKRVKDAFLFTVKVSMLSMVAFGAVEFIFASPLIGIFRDDAEVIRVGTTALRFICVMLPFANFIQNASTLFQVVEKPLPSSVLIFSRQLIFYIPALLILPGILQLIGVQIAGPLADMLTFLVALPMVWYYFKKTEGKGNEKKAL